MRVGVDLAQHGPRGRPAQQLLTDPHSPGEYRTNGVLVNMPEFYAAFGVKEGDKMYLPPDKRVKIW